MSLSWSHITVRTARDAVEKSGTLGGALDKQPFKQQAKCDQWNDLVIFLWSRKHCNSQQMIGVTDEGSVTFTFSFKPRSPAPKSGVY